MPRHLDLIRRSALPSHQMMTAAKGALHIGAEEMVEILVYLAENNKIFGEQARMTLAGWDEDAAKKIASNPATPAEVLNYWISPKNLRPVLFPLLLENPSVSVNKIGHIGATEKGEWIDAMLASPRVRRSAVILQELSTNNQLSGGQIARLQELINGKPAAAPVETAPEPRLAAILARQQGRQLLCATLHQVVNRRLSLRVPPPEPRNTATLQSKSRWHLPRRKTPP
jgi:hypothetical protein